MLDISGFPIHGPGPISLEKSDSPAGCASQPQEGLPDFSELGSCAVTSPPPPKYESDSLFNVSTKRFTENTTKEETQKTTKDIFEALDFVGDLDLDEKSKGKVVLAMNLFHLDHNFDKRGELTVSCVLDDKGQRIGVSFEIRRERYEDGVLHHDTHVLDVPFKDYGVAYERPKPPSPPILGIIPIPSLLVDKVDIDFSIEVKAPATSPKIPEPPKF